MAIQETIIFNGITYRRMGGKRGYYLSQSSRNCERKGAKGLHVAIWEFYSGKTVPKGFVVHHKDHNPFNNDFSNLECISRSEHLKLHKEDRLKWVNSEKGRKHLEDIRELTKEWHRSEEGRKWHSENSKKYQASKRKTKICTQCGRKFETCGKTEICHWCYDAKYQREKRRRKKDLQFDNRG